MKRSLAASTARGLAAALFVAVSVLSAGCDSKPAGKSSAPEEQKTEPTASFDLDGARKWAAEHAEKGLGEAQSFTTATWNEYIEPHRESARYLLNDAGGRLQGGLERLAAKPDEKATVEQKALGFATAAVPVLGPAVLYTEARLEYQAASKRSDPQERTRGTMEAKRKCLLACMKGGIDITVLGTSGMVDQAARHAGEVLKVLKVGQKLGVFAQIGFVDQLTPFLDAALQIPEVDAAMEAMLKLDLTKLGDDVLGR